MKRSGCAYPRGVLHEESATLEVLALALQRHLSFTGPEAVAYDPYERAGHPGGTRRTAAVSHGANQVQRVRDEMRVDLVSECLDLCVGSRHFGEHPLRREHRYSTDHPDE